MKTSHGKLAMLAFVLLLAAVLFVPVRAGQEDRLVLEPDVLRMSVGNSYTLRCALSSEDENQMLGFSSSDPRVATIDPDGTVHAHASGEATISAWTSGGATARMQVSVAGVPLTQLELNVDELRIEKGQYSGLRVSYNQDASDTRLQWISSNESVVRVDSTGRVEGVGGGMAYVSVLAPSGRSASARVYVDVDGTAVHISPNDLTLGVGAEVPLRVSYLPLDCTDGVRRWASSNPNVVTVDEMGVLHARGQGSAYVTVLTNGGLTAGMEVRVEAAPNEIQVNPTKATLERGSSLQLQLMFLKEDGSADANRSHLTVWKSDDESIATVDASGLVTALKSGACTIEATADGMTATCRLNVETNVQEIRLARDEIYLLREETGRPLQLGWKLTPADADDLTVTFTSNNEQVATASETGLITLTGGYGTATITASCASGAQDSFTVHVVTQLPEKTGEVPVEAVTASEVPASVETDAFGAPVDGIETDAFGAPVEAFETDAFGAPMEGVETDAFGAPIEAETVGGTTVG